MPTAETAEEGREGEREGRRREGRREGRNEGSIGCTPGYRPNPGAAHRKRGKTKIIGSPAEPLGCQRRLPEVRSHLGGARRQRGQAARQPRTTLIRAGRPARRAGRASRAAAPRGAMARTLGAESAGAFGRPTQAETAQLCPGQRGKWLLPEAEAAGRDAVHLLAGFFFTPPAEAAGRFLEALRLSSMWWSATARFAWVQSSGQMSLGTHSPLQR